MDAEGKRRLQLNHDYLIKNLSDVHDIAIGIVSKTGTRDLDKILGIQSEDRETFLECLQKIKGGYGAFCESLEERNFGWIVQKLNETDISEDGQTVPAETPLNRSLSLLESKRKYFPRKNENFTGRERELHRLHDEFHNSSAKSAKRRSHGTSRQVMRIHGLGGVGKSQIAIEYIHRHQDEYRLIRWIRSGPHSIRNSIIKFAKDLEVNVEEVVDDKDIALKISDVLFTYDSWLLVFDYVVSNDDIKPFMPDLDRLKEGQNIIITSVTPLGTTSCLEVKTFTEEEAYEYVSSRLPHIANSDYKNVETVKNLTKQLGNLPLALSQAIAFIKFCSCNIDKYIKILSTSHELLDKNVHFENHAKKSVYFTLMTSIRKILDDQSSSIGEQADTLLKCISLLDSEDIPLSLFEEDGFFSGDILNKSVAKLREYSLISSQRPGTVRIHKLVQRVVQEYLYKFEQPSEVEQIGLRLKALKRLPTMFKKKLPRDCSCIGWRNVNRDVLDTLQSLLPHAKSLLWHIDQELEGLNELTLPSEDQRTDVRKQQDDLIQCKDTVLFFIGFSYYFLRDALEAASAFKDLVQVRSETGKGDDVKKVEALEMLGICNRLSRNHEDSVGNLTKALDILNNLQTSNHDQLRIAIMTALGKTRYIKGEYQESCQLLEEALNLQSSFSKTCPEKKRDVSCCLLSYILPKLGSAYLGAGKLPEARVKFEKCLEVRQKLYYEGHILLAASRFCLGKVQLLSNDFENAQESFQFCLECAESNYGKQHSFVGKVNAIIGKCCILQEKYPDACKSLTTALKILAWRYGEMSEIHDVVQKWLKHAMEPDKCSFEDTERLYLFDF